MKEHRFSIEHKRKYVHINKHVKVNVNMNTRLHNLNKYSRSIQKNQTVRA